MQRVLQRKRERDGEREKKRDRDTRRKKSFSSKSTHFDEQKTIFLFFASFD